MSKHTEEQISVYARFLENRHDLPDAVAFLRAYADLLAEREKAEPVVWPNGMDAGDVSSWLKDRSRFLDPYIQGPMMQAIAVLIEDIPLFTHPPVPPEGAGHD